MLFPSPTFTPAVILLAAGASTRMGRPKLLLPWNGTTAIGHLIRLWTELGTAQIGVVCAPDDMELGEELDRLQFPAENRILNPDSWQGMFSSIQCAALWPGWKPGLTHWVIVLGDQPHLGLESLRDLIALAAQRPDRIVQPGRSGRPRHPVILPARQFCELGAGTSGTSGTLKEFLQAREAQVELLEMDDPGFDLDLDQPADVEAAARLRSHNNSIT